MTRLLRRQQQAQAADAHHRRAEARHPAHHEGQQRDGDDSPVRLILAFEGDRSKFSAKDAMVNELARLLTGEEMPYATLMYVWCNKRPVDSVISSPRTDRIRKIVVESGAQGLTQWRNYERDIRADYLRAFGEAPGALVAIGLILGCTRRSGGGGGRRQGGAALASAGLQQQGLLLRREGLPLDALPKAKLAQQGAPTWGDAAGANGTQSRLWSFPISRLVSRSERSERNQTRGRRGICRCPRQRRHA